MVDVGTPARRPTSPIVISISSMGPLDLNSGSSVKVDGMTDALVPNHHAHYPAFAGVSGLVAALSMVRGRETQTKLALDLAGLRAADRVIDIGCGPGAAARHAARLGATVVGIDPSP